MCVVSSRRLSRFEQGGLISEGVESDVHTSMSVRAAWRRKMLLSSPQLREQKQNHGGGWLV